MGSALVLGGGGVTGIAWTTGLLLGLAEGGVDVTGADLIVGTSAGAAVGAQVATGRSLDELFERQCADEHQEIAAELDLEALMPIVTEMRAREGRPLDQAGLARIGTMALGASTVSEAERRAVIEARLGTDEWPAGGRLRVTAIDAAAGELVVFDGTDPAGPGLIDAVAASCAVPGVWPPVTIGDRRYVDGGVRSVANADLAAGASPALLLAPLGAAAGPGIELELAALGGGRTLLVQSDRATQDAMGINPLDPARRRPSAEAGRRQAADVLDAVRDTWLGLP
jgi:NTE family protein